MYKKLSTLKSQCNGFRYKVSMFSLHFQRNCYSLSIIYTYSLYNLIYVLQLPVSDKRFLFCIPSKIFDMPFLYTLSQNSLCTPPLSHNFLHLYYAASTYAHTRTCMPAGEVFNFLSISRCRTWVSTPMVRTRVVLCTLPLFAKPLVTRHVSACVFLLQFLCNTLKHNVLCVACVRYLISRIVGTCCQVVPFGKCQKPPYNSHCSYNTTQEQATSESLE